MSCLLTRVTPVSGSCTSSLEFGGAAREGEGRVKFSTWDEMRRQHDLLVQVRMIPALVVIIIVVVTKYFKNFEV